MNEETINYCRCSLAAFYPDGSIRCILDNSPATEPCDHKVDGVPKVLSLKELSEKEEKPKIVKHKLSEKEVKEKERPVQGSLL